MYHFEVAERTPAEWAKRGRNLFATIGGGCLALAAGVQSTELAGMGVACLAIAGLGELERRYFESRQPEFEDNVKEME